MFNTETTALRRGIHKEASENISEYQTGTPTLVASKLLELETAGNGERSVVNLTKVAAMP